MSSTKIIVPILGFTDEVLGLSAADLPDDPDDILDVLQQETVPLPIWFEISAEYYRQGKKEHCKHILKYLEDNITTPEMQRIYKDVRADHVRVLNSLASFYMEQAKQERDEKKRTELGNQCTQYLNAAGRMMTNYSMQDPNVFVARAMSTLVPLRFQNLAPSSTDLATKLQSAEMNLNNALAMDSTCIAAMMGKASILFMKEQYTDALAQYVKALEMNPSAPASVRVGIGMCFYRLKNFRKAHQALKRAIEIDPENVEALVGLAILELNAERPESAGGQQQTAQSIFEKDDETLDAMEFKAKHVRRAIEYLRRAYSVSPSTSSALNHLANHFFYKSDLDKVRALAQRSLESTEDPKLKAEAAYHIARSLHSENDFEGAHERYLHAVTLWPDFTLAHYGLGQIYLHQNKKEDAIRSFEKVLERHPDCFEALRILGTLHAEGNPDLAMSHLRSASKVFGEDPELYVEMAQVQERRNPAEAEKCYDKAIETLTKRNETVPNELYNNLGAICHKSGNLEKARKSYLAALAQLGVDESDTEVLTSRAVTTLYNLARLDEDRGEDAKAESMYRAIVKKHPNYVHGYLRLGHIAQKKHDYADAVRWYKLAIGIRSDDTDAWCMLGTLFMDRGDLFNAQRTFEKIKAEVDTSDLFALVSLGNIYLHAAAASADKEDKNLDYARGYYEQALKLDKDNMFAASGLAAVIAERGYLPEAKSIFLRAQESLVEAPEVVVNLGHINMAMKSYERAIKLYAKVLKDEHEGRNVELLTFIARAYFEQNKLAEAKSTIQKALHLEPRNSELRFNLAYTLLETFLDTMRTHGTEVSFVRATRAIADLKEAQRMFKQLAHVKDKSGNELHIKAEKCTRTCETNLRKVEADLPSIQQRDAQKLQEAEVRRRAYEEKKEKQRKEREETEAKAREAAEAARLVAEEKMREVEELLSANRSAEPRDLRDEGQMDVEGEAAPSKKRKDKKDRTVEPEGVETVEEGGAMEEGDGQQEGEDDAERREKRKEKKEKKKKDKSEKKHKKKKDKKSKAEGEEGEAAAEGEGGEGADGEKKKKKKKKHRKHHKDGEDGGEDSERKEKKKKKSKKNKVRSDDEGEGEGEGEGDVEQSLSKEIFGEDDAWGEEAENENENENENEAESTEAELGLSAPRPEDGEGEEEVSFSSEKQGQKRKLDESGDEQETESGDKDAEKEEEAQKADESMNGDGDDAEPQEPEAKRPRTEETNEENEQPPQQSVDETMPAETTASTDS